MTKTIQKKSLSIYLAVLFCYVRKSASFELPQQTVVVRESRMMSVTNPSSVDSFLDSLDHYDTLNIASKKRTQFLNRVMESKEETDVKNLLKKQKKNNDLSVRNPGLWESMQPVAAGNWKVIYAPHMSTIASLAGGGDLNVQYLLNGDGTLQSHARFSNFWWIPGSPKTLYLSVSGTFGSVSEKICKVEWDRAWVRVVDDANQNNEPYANFEDVPDSIMKETISRIGNSFFIKAVSTFPISFLSNKMIVFDFELLGTRICALKIESSQPQKSMLPWKF